MSVNYQSGDFCPVPILYGAALTYLVLCHLMGTRAISYTLPPAGLAHSPLLMTRQHMSHGSSAYCPGIVMDGMYQLLTAEWSRVLSHANSLVVEVFPWQHVPDKDRGTFQAQLPKTVTQLFL